uniref:Thioesterase domain-containing protein n=1 Tax=Eptatretus burgeri TaxID=7764 RepID=A0A8C4QCY5_EPTBU
MILCLIIVCIMLDSLTSLFYLPYSCYRFVHPPAWVTMKLMDEVAGIVAVRHCKSNVVTACVDAMNFHRKLKLGEPCTSLSNTLRGKTALAFPLRTLETEDEKKRFEEGKARYLQSKAKREAQQGSA